MKNMSKQGKIWLIAIFLITATFYISDFITNSYVLILIPVAYILGYVIGEKNRS